MSDIKTESLWLMKGDCLERMKEIESGSVDLTVTSPPYDNLRTYNNSLEWGEHVWKPVLQELFRVTKQGGVVVWVVGDATIKGSETGTSFKQALYAKEVGFNLHDTMIYNKGGAGGAKGSNYCYTQTFEFMFIFSKGKPSRLNLLKDRENKYLKKGESSMRKKDGSLIRFTASPNVFSKRTNVWDIRAGFMQSTTDKIAYQHPAIFPEKLANDHIISWSNEGDTVLDCFMGSGTTGKMALINNRKFIGIEKDAGYFDISSKRISEINKDE